MKQFLSIIGLAAICSQLTADVITPQQALQLASPYMQQGAQSAALRLSPSQQAGTGSALTSVASQSDSLPELYILSRGQGQGFVIVSGDDCLPSVLGVVDEGDYDESDMPDAFREWLLLRAQQIAFARQNGVNTPRQVIVADDRQDVPYLLTTLWHQSSPYNDRCPIITSSGAHALTGCVATATSQIVYYWRRDANQTLAQTTPTYSYGDAPCTADFQLQAGTPIKFDLMQTSYSGSELAEYRNAVATLCAACGMTAWLTYGSSTSGQISDCVNVFGAQFGINGGTCVYKDGNYSENGWSKLLYDQLIQGRPLLYCGYNNSNGGHAVVCDGYQASTGFFHINFGWGSGYNGYFSVEDGVTGWNFNDAYQGCVYDIYPKRPNVTVSVSLPHSIYVNSDNTFQFSLTNLGTVPVRNVYLFVNQTGNAPKSINDANSSLTDLDIQPDASQSFALTGRPSASGTNWVILTDGDLHVLCRQQVEVESAASALSVVGLEVMTSSDVTEYAGHTFGIGYSNKSTVQVTVRNASPSGFDGSIRLNFYHYNTSAQTWEVLGTKTSTLQVDGNATAISSSYILSSFVKQNEYYYVEVCDSISPTQRLDLSQAGDNRFYFTLRDKDMAVVSYQDRILTLSGHFDYTEFNASSFAKKSAYSDAVGYDLTQCTAVRRVSQSINPNALYYVSDDSQATGANIVRQGHCERLELSEGYDFVPRESFSCDSASIHLSLTPAQWRWVTLPFQASVPTGMVARHLDSHKSNSISGCTTDVNTLQPGQTYMLMTSSTRHLELTGGASQVVTAPEQTADTLVHGTFATCTTTASTYDFDDSDPQLFVLQSAGQSIAPFGGWMNACSDFTKSFSTYGTLLYDASFLQLARSISQAYTVLDQYAESVTTEAYDAYLQLILEAEQMFSDRANTPASTDIRACATNLTTEGEVYRHQLTDVGQSEIDFTSSLVNPSFEAKDLTGWTLGELSGYSSVGGVYNGTLTNIYHGVGLDGTYLFRSMIAKADSSSVSLSQTVTGLTPGRYRITALVGTDPTDSVTLFAADTAVTVAGHPFGALYLTQVTLADVMVVADDGADTGSLTLGIREGHWYKADNFTLTYTGSLASGNESGIQPLTPEASTDGIFSLSGQRLQQTSGPGLYIVGGRKVLIRK